MARQMKTKPAEGVLRTLSGKIRILNRQGDYLFPVELWMLNDQVNRNNWRYIKVAENAAKFLGVPILTAYVNGEVGDGHNFQEETDKEGNPSPSFTGPTDERIVGAISEDKGDVRVETVDGVTWIVGVGTIYAWYAKEVVRKLRDYAEQGREIPVSIETLVSKSRMEGRVEVEEEYEVLGVTILGDHVTPAVAGARIAALSRMGNELKELKMRAASYANEKISDKKGMRNLSVYTKKQCDALQEKFASWRVLAANEDENGIHVALLSDNYDIARYDMDSAEDAISENKITVCSATVDIGIGTNVDITPIMEDVTRLNSELAKAKATITERDNQIAAMTTAENKRRLNEAREIAKRTLSAFNACREDKIADNAIQVVMDKIECGDYTGLNDKDGLWCGGKAVEDAVYAICARKVQEADLKAAERAKTVFSYDRFRDNGKQETDNGDVSGLLRKLGIKD